MNTRELPIILHINETPRITEETKGRMLPTGHVLPVLWPGRECGACSMCCSILAVHEDGVDTKYGETCEHSRNHRGCAIYETRPGVCKTWSCLWRLGILPPELRPDKVKAVLEVQAAPDDRCIVVHVKPKHKGVWRQDGALRDYLKQVRRTMLAVIIVCGHERFLIGEPWQYQIKPEMGNPDGSVTPTIDTYEEIR
jgi:hypothetical protein